MSFFSFEPSGAWSSLGAAVLHFLWQGALVGCVTAGILIFVRRTSSSARHAVALGGLLVGFLLFSGTFLHYLVESPTAALPSAGMFSASSVGEGTLAAQASSFNGALIAAWCWLVGALVMSIRLMRNCLGVRRLKTTQTSVPEAHWISAFQELRLELGIKRVVRLVGSGLAEVPMVVGWISPIVIVPVAAFASLDPAQLRCLLVHELQHIRRHDHLINAIQVVLETILFFHPVVWWLSKQMRLEREYCCDQTALQLTGDPKLLAQALASMEALRIQQPNPDFILAANGGPLMQRITRILGLRSDRRSSFSGWQLPVGLIVAGVLATAGQTMAQPGTVQEGDAVVQKSDQEAARQRKARSEWLKVEAKLKALVKAGKITPDQAKARLGEYRKKLAEEKAARNKKGSDQATGKERLDVYGRKLRQAVADGKMTTLEARSNMEKARRRMAEHQAKAGGEKPGASRKKAKDEYARAEAETKKLVESGVVSELQAQKRLAEIRLRLAEKEREKVAEAQADRRKFRTEYAAAEKKMRKLVENGMATEAQVEQRLGEMRDRKAQADKRKSRAEYVAAEKQMRRLVEVGTITNGQVERHLAEMRKQMGAGQETIGAKGADQRRRENAVRYDAVEKELNGLVKAGLITSDQAKRRLERLRKSFGESKAKPSKEDVRAQYEAAAARMRKAEKAGKLSPEDTRAKLEALEKHLRDIKSSAENKKDIEVRAQYEAGEARVKAAIKAGKLTPEEGRKRLIEFRKRLGRERSADKAKGRKPSDR